MEKRVEFELEKWFALRIKIDCSEVELDGKDNFCRQFALFWLKHFDNKAKLLRAFLEKRVEDFEKKNNGV